MKKLLVLSMILTMATVISAQAEEPTTYTEMFIKKHTQKIVDKEKELQKEQQAREEAAAKQRQERQDAINKKLEEHTKALEKAREQREAESKARQEKIERKKQLWNELISD